MEIAILVGGKDQDRKESYIAYLEEKVSSSLFKGEEGHLCQTRSGVEGKENRTRSVMKQHRVRPSEEEEPTWVKEEEEKSRSERTSVYSSDTQRKKEAIRGPNPRSKVQPKFLRGVLFSFWKFLHGERRRITARMTS